MYHFWRIRRLCYISSLFTFAGNKTLQLQKTLSPVTKSISLPSSTVVAPILYYLKLLFFNNLNSRKVTLSKARMKNNEERPTSLQSSIYGSSWLQLSYHYRTYILQFQDIFSFLFPVYLFHSKRLAFSHCETHCYTSHIIFDPQWLTTFVQVWKISAPVILHWTYTLLNQDRDLLLIILHCEIYEIILSSITTDIRDPLVYPFPEETIQAAKLHISWNYVYTFLRLAY